MEAYSLSEVNKYIKQVIALNFQETLWIKAEISQIKESRGQYYLELVEKDETTDEVVAKMNAAIWYKSYLFIRKKLGDLADQILQDGTSIQCKASIDFHEKYGLKFTIEDIDPSYTFGQLELERQKTLQKLKEENLLEKNKYNTSPGQVIQRIAIISSKTAAGYIDFKEQLFTNPYTYAFGTKLFNASVQGKNLEPEILKSLDKVEALKDQFDCVVIIRGGGSKLDLSGFDSYEIAKKVANFPIPVLSGIGHEIDNNVIEFVVYKALKTPTAVANYILDHNTEFEGSILDQFQKIRFAAFQNINSHKNKITQFRNNLKNNSYLHLNKAAESTKNIKTAIVYNYSRALSESKHQLEKIYQQIEYSNPQKILDKGYSLNYKNNKLVSSTEQLEIGDQLTSHLKDGKMTVSVKSIEKNK